MVDSVALTFRDIDNIMKDWSEAQFGIDDVKMCFCKGSIGSLWPRT